MKEPAPESGPGTVPENRGLADPARFYDRRYAEYYMEETPSFEARKIGDVLGSLPPGLSRILDFGCGQGRLTSLLGRVFKNAEVSGVDISEKALALARQKHPGLEFVPFDGEETPFADQTFDLVFSYHVLEHVPDLAASLAEMARLTAPGGYALACLPCGDPGSLASKIVDRIRGGREVSPTGEERFFFEDRAHLRRAASQDLIRGFSSLGFDLAAGFYANQFWGEVEYLVRGGLSRIRRTFPLFRAKGPGSLLWLLSLALPLALLSLPARLGQVPVRARIRSAAGPARKLMWILLAPLKLVSRPIGAGLEGLAGREWNRRRLEPGGSAQYLIFRRRD